MYAVLRRQACGLATTRPAAEPVCLAPRVCAAPVCRSRVAFGGVQAPAPQEASTAAPSTVCHSLDPRGGGKTAGFQFNVAYAAIIGTYAALFLFKNPYIFAALCVLTIIPQNSAITSLNSLVILFYDSGLFMNFAEAVYCVRLMTWLSIACMLVSFAIFS
ncbi:hypothetical protein HYH03_004689 [Edaphochlamys debaryana]|uniref:Uncharacterized protein n=1 Tax=Edaphochlamys debaryana TaxID=47281 RepID=A0A836C2V1_9CHLO|nr:hypothetical protein HYH03_004689 [Edaphochlamys debaryana]|eukprot:KAG2497098.1 hypothetical protein HYH03_004689 [Edaphochlamys debaryana]